ncbi:hypothetical protein MTR_2g055800 [Medicago truncatula]|uniref:Uncharacterized protein n=1 Tax=Medicago truncatula TaxID=3880 RepID=A0A072VIM4_MEDTR|nr:hypothetical protein MTR_2g055800 [Medicago truncatula]
MAAWLDIVDSETEEAYIDNWTQFKVVCAKFSMFLDYVEKTILDPVKEKFVRFWIDKNLHMGEYYNKQSRICTHSVEKVSE